MLTALLISPHLAMPDFWSIKGHGELQTVTLTRKLPPVALRNGRTVRFEPTISGNSIPPEAATIMKDRIATLLMKAKSGGIQLVDGPADTVIKCMITGYEEKKVYPSEREVGLKKQKVDTWVGNIEASVQVLDGQGYPIDAGNIKYHLESDYVVSQQEEADPNANNKKKESLADRLARVAKAAKGGDPTEVTEVLAGKKASEMAAPQQKGSMRPPTDQEWKDMLIDGLADKVANRIVPIDQTFVAILPVDKEFKEIDELAKSNHWGDVQEQTEKMGQLKDSKEAYRLYTLGLSYEAIACGDIDKPDEAADLLNKASKQYAEARKLRPEERELLLAQIRVQDSIDHYLEIQNYLASRKNNPTPPPTPATSTTAAPEDAREKDVADNSALIEMAKANMSQSFMLTFVQSASNPKFDTSSKGLLDLVRAHVPEKVISAAQQKMLPARPAHKAAKPVASVQKSAPVGQSQ